MFVDNNHHYYSLELKKKKKIKSQLYEEKINK